MLKDINIADIQVGSRHRKDMGDLTALADSIHQEGLLQPIERLLADIFGVGAWERVQGPDSMHLR